MRNSVITPVLLLTVVIGILFTSCKPKKNDPVPDNKDTTNPVNKLPVASFAFAKDTIYLKDDSVAVNVTNTSTNATSWYWAFASCQNPINPVTDIIKKSTGESASCYYSTQLIANQGYNYKVTLVAKNAKGDSSYVGKNVTIIDNRLKVNVKVNIDPGISQTLTSFGVSIDGKGYDGDMNTMTIKLPWYLLNKTTMFYCQLKDPWNGDYPHASQSFTLAKDGINIIMSIKTINTLTIDGIAMLAQ